MATDKYGRIINPNLITGLSETYGLDSLEKGGEGSKGGQVIGHTKSGKPIYANSLHTSKDFTHEDHSDAMTAHMKEAKNQKDNEKHYLEGSKKYGAGEKDNKGFDHNKRLTELSNESKEKSQHHSSMAELHSKAMNDKLDQTIKNGEDTLEKGKSAMVGETRNWNGKNYKKQPNGKWLEVSRGGLTNREHKDKSYEHENNTVRLKPYSDKLEDDRIYAEKYREKYHREQSSKLSDKEHSDEEVGLGVEKVEMNNLDWGKTTAERNANLDKYHSLKTDKEKSDFTKKLKESNEGLKQGDTFNHPKHGEIKYSHKIHGSEEEKPEDADYYFNNKADFKVKLSHKEVQSLSKKDTIKKSLFSEKFDELDNIFKALTGKDEDQEGDILEKGGKRATVGEVRMYGGKKYVKHSEGWVYVNEGGQGKVYDGKISEAHSKPAEQHHIDHHKEHVGRHEREVGKATKSETNKGEKKEEKHKVGENVTLGKDVNLISLSHLKGKKLTVTGHVNSGLISQPTFTKVKDEDGEEHELDPDHLEVHGEDKSSKSSETSKEDDSKSVIENTTKNPYVDIINSDFEKWNKIKTDTEQSEWKKNVPKLGTHGTINIADFIERNKSTLKIKNSRAFNDYLNEMN